MNKPIIRNLLLTLLVLSIGFNLYMHQIYNNHIHQKQRQNRTDLWAISSSGGNLADRLEQFLVHSQGTNNEEMQKTVADSWRIVLGESQETHLYLGRLSPHYMKELKPQWSLLQHSLLRINHFLLNLNHNFLAQGSYSISNEEAEKLNAIVTIYKKLHEEVAKKSKKPELVIDSLTEQMMIIDPHYSRILETVKPD